MVQNYKADRGEQTTDVINKTIILQMGLALMSIIPESSLADSDLDLESNKSEFIRSLSTFCTTSADSPVQVMTARFADVLNTVEKLGNFENSKTAIDTLTVELNHIRKVTKKTQKEKKPVSDISNQIRMLIFLYKKIACFSPISENCKTNFLVMIFDFLIQFITWKFEKQPFTVGEPIISKIVAKVYKIPYQKRVGIEILNLIIFKIYEKIKHEMVSMTDIIKWKEITVMDHYMDFQLDLENDDLDYGAKNLISLLIISNDIFI